MQLARPEARPAHPIRLIALDLDGTLLRSDRTVGPRTISALRRAHAQGIEIVLASGRMTPAMEAAAEALGIDCCIVSYNGAAVCARRAGGRKRIFHQPLPVALSRELFQYARARRIQINFYHEDVIISEDDPAYRPFIDIYRSRTGSPFQLVKGLENWLHHAPTKMLFIVDPAERDRIAEELRPSFGTRATIVRTDPEYLEFLDPAVNKGVGVSRLAEVLGVPMSQVMAVGDGENDIQMLQAAGWPVAMANGSPECRAAARVVTERDHENEGVAEAVERWALR